MGCIQSSEISEKKSSSMGPITAIGRTERMTHRSTNTGTGTTSSTRNVKNGAPSLSASASANNKISAPKTKSNSKSKSSIQDPTNDLKIQLKQSIRDRINGSLQDPDLDVSGRLMPGEIASRRELSVKPKSTTIMDGDITIEYAFCSQRGYYPDDPHKPNQDCFSITHNFASIKADSFFGVYDGHGPVGEHYATYTKQNLPTLLAKYIHQERVNAHKERNASLPPSTKNIPFNPKLFPLLESKAYESASKKAHVECNQKMIDTQPLHNLSGSTAISAGFHNGQLIISNVGDSRAILGYKEQEEHENGSSQTIIAVPLSQDQTPWRRDERERIIKAGGRVMTIDQMEGNVNGNGDMVGDIGDNHDKDNTDRKLGEDDFIDEKGDPPRVWLSDKNVPGTSFTRSLGDSIANKVGVFAEPEFFSKTITDEDEILVLASDGVFEFLQNQEIIDICAKSDNPVKACELVVDAAYTKWLEYENRTDDITAIIMYFRREQARGVNVDNDNDNDGEVTVPQAAK